MSMQCSTKSVTLTTLLVPLVAIGVPVFAGFAGGLPHLVGLTGGYLWGFLPCAVLSGWLGRRGGYFLPLGFAVGTVVIYAVGTLWYLLQTQATIGAALLTCVLPFLPADAVKIGVALVVTQSLRRHLPQATIPPDKGEKPDESV